jgi:aspartate 1-decarboxylase
MKEVLCAKIHNAFVTQARLDYIGSITIDQALLDKVGLWPGQKVLVVSNTTGARLETYVIPGEKNSGIICMNGACSHLIKEKEQIIIMGFEFVLKPLVPKCILVDENNKFKSDLGQPEHGLCEVI